MRRALAVAGLMLAVGLAPACGAEQTDKWQPGTNYTVLSQAGRSIPGRKVVVTEVFWYGCGHCWALDPALEYWNTKKPEFVEFVRTPVMWGPIHRQHARLYYTLRELGRLDLHPKVFDAIHKEGQMLAARTEEDARAQQQAFLEKHGVKKKDFDAAYDSTAVSEGLSHAEQVTLGMRVESVPILFVNRRYSTTVSQAGDSKKLLELLDDLAESEYRP